MTTTSAVPPASSSSSSAKPAHGPVGGHLDGAAAPARRARCGSPARRPTAAAPRATGEAKTATSSRSALTRPSPGSRRSRAPRRVAAAGGHAGRRDRLEPGEVVGGELDGRGGDVVLQVGPPLGARDRDDVRALGEHPGQRQLAGASTPFSSASARTASTSRRFAGERVALEARVGAPEVVLAEVVAAGDRAGEEAAAERAVGHDADPVLAGDPTVPTPPPASRSRVHSDHSLCSAAIGWTATARRMRGGAGLRQPEVADLALLRRARPSRRRCPRSAPSGPPGAGSRGRSRRPPAGAGWPRRRPARSPAGRRSRMPPSSSRHSENLVASCTSSRRPAMASPTSSSLWPLP